jgi:hypothetical protein
MLQLTEVGIFLSISSIIIGILGYHMKIVLIMWR